jgi:hypothetical protein
MLFNMSVISDMSTEQETEVFSPSFVSAGRYRGGPHGVGDPNDKSLRKVELEVCIPGIIRERAHREKCQHFINGETNQSVFSFFILIR